MILKLLTEHHLEFLSLKGGQTGSSESTLVKMPHCWKSHATAHMTMKVQKFNITDQPMALSVKHTQSLIHKYAQIVSRDLFFNA